MLSKNSKESKRPIRSERTFPWRCRHCGQDLVRIAKLDYDAEVRHDGRLHSFKVSSLEIPVCQGCGEKVFTEVVDEQVNTALRAHLHLLAPEEMRAALERVNMTQKDAAERLGIAEATLSRWLTKTQIQSRAMDNLLRVFFAFPEVRTVLNGESQDPHLGSTDRTEQQPTTRNAIDENQLNAKFGAIAQSLAELKEAIKAFSAHGTY